MRYALMLVLSFAGCGGPSQSTAPNAPSPASEAPITVAELDRIADEICACPDVTCGEQARQKLFAASHRPIAEADRPALAATYDRGMQCLAPLMFGQARQDYMAQATRTADAVCACTSTDCAIQAGISGLGYMERIPHNPDEAADAHVKREGQRATACYKALPGATNPAQSEARLTRFADDVCACAGAAACIDGHGQKLRAAIQADPGGVIFADHGVVDASSQRAIGCGWKPE